MDRLVVNGDFETGSDMEIRWGLSRYCDSDNFAAHCFCYKFSDDPQIYTWQPHTVAMLAKSANANPLDRSEPHLARLLDCINDRNVIFQAFNAEFEIAVFFKLMKLGLCPMIGINRWRCSRVDCSALGLRGGLGRIADKLECESKMNTGKRLIQEIQYDPEYGYGKIPFLIDDLIEYCEKDVEVEVEVSSKVSPVVGWELDVWHRHLKMNFRGVKIDREMAQAALDIYEEVGQSNDAKLKEITGEDLKMSQSVAIANWVNQRPCMVGNRTEGIAKDLLPRIKARAIDGQDEALAALCELKLNNPEASIAKYKAALDAVCDDGYLRNMFIYCGAHTRRWTSIIVQLQNLNRGFEDIDIEALCDAIKRKDKEYLSKFGPIIKVLGKAVRHMLCTPEGYDMMIWDYSQIEARTLAYLADDAALIKFFKDTDEDPDLGIDIYKYTYGQMFQCDPKSVTKSQRAIGKVCQLLLGYAGGAGSIVLFCMKTNLDLMINWKSSVEAYPDIAQSLDWCWDKYGKKTQLPKKLWYAAELYKKIWRQANPDICSLWDHVEEEIKIAVVTREDRVIELAGGKYPISVEFFNGKKDMVFVTNFSRGQIYLDMRYDGNDLFYRDAVKTTWSKTYGGDLAQTINQGFARDLMSEGWSRLPQKHVMITGTVHDEVFGYSKKRISEKVLKHGDKVLSMPYRQAPGLSLTSAGEITSRYKK